jgi:hypothetical protein
MKGFFDELQEFNQTMSNLIFDDTDLKKFKNRMGAKYADVYMGVRLCWVVPSTMPRSEDNSDGDLKWYGEVEYGDPSLIQAYSELVTNNKMQRMMRVDKAHAHAYMHKFPEVVKVPEEANKPKQTLIKERLVPEYFFTFPLVEVIGDAPVALDPTDWNIQETDYSLEVESENTISSLLNKLKEDTDFKILLEYIFPISSIIPEVATIYGMEFFKAVSEYITHRKQYFGAVRAGSDALIDSLVTQNKESYDFAGDEA